MSLYSGLSVLIILSKNHFLVSLIFWIFLDSSLLISKLYYFFPSAYLNSLCWSFSNSSLFLFLGGSHLVALRVYSWLFAHGSFLVEWDPEDQTCVIQTSLIHCMKGNTLPAILWLQLPSSFFSSLFPIYPLPGPKPSVSLACLFWRERR